MRVLYYHLVTLTPDSKIPIQLRIKRNRSIIGLRILAWCCHALWEDKHDGATAYGLTETMHTVRDLFYVFFLVGVGGGCCDRFYPQTLEIT